VAPSENILKSIVLFDQYPYLGGGQVVLLSAVEAAIAVVSEVAVVVPVGGPLEAVIRRRYGARVRVVGTWVPKLSHGRKTIVDMLLLAVGTVWILLRHIRIVLGADLLYGNGPRQFVALIMWSTLLRKKCIYHVHLDLDSFGKWLIGLAACVPGTKGIIFTSRFIQERMVTAVPSLANRKNAVVVENALSPKYQELQFVNRFDSFRSGLNVLVPGVIRPEKGQDIAVDLARAFSALTVHIVGRVGDGCDDWVAGMRTTAPSNVRFHAPVEDLGKLIDEIGIHVVLVPSRVPEAFGLVAIEGMAESCVTVVSAVGALPEIAAKTGALLYSGEPHELGKIVGRLIQLGAPELTQIAEVQFTNTMMHYRPDRMISDLRQVITMAIGGSEVGFHV
jgi:glycosyltransferase involved in cell wall biosynthesis